MLEIETTTVALCAPGTQGPPRATDSDSLPKSAIGEETTLIIAKTSVKCFNAGASLLGSGYQ